MAKAIKKAKKPPAPKPTDGVFVRFGSAGGPGAMGPWERFQTDGAARKAMTDFFKSWDLWVSLHNRKALVDIANACTEVAGLAINHTTKVVTCLVDDYTTPQVRLVAEVQRRG